MGLEGKKKGKRKRMQHIVESDTLFACAVDGVL